MAIGKITPYLVKCRLFFTCDNFSSSLMETVKIPPNHNHHLNKWRGVTVSRAQSIPFLSPSHLQSRRFHQSCLLKGFAANYSSAYEKYKPVFLLAEKHLDRTAVVDTNGAFTYADILHHSMVLNIDILQLMNPMNPNKLNEERIALLTEQDVSYVIGQFATWIANGISVPLCTSHPPSEWQYFLEDSQCSLLLVGETFHNKIAPIANELGIPIKVLRKMDQSQNNYHKNQWFLSEFASNASKISRSFIKRKKRWFDNEDEYLLKKKPALIIYTSGTTGRPKGVVLTHGNLSAMINGMIKSWAWSPLDTILHVLPLHHVHGVVDVLLTPLACGATCVMEKKFDARRVWNLLTTPSIDFLDRGINLFMAVPTVYAKMIQFYEEEISSQKAEMTADFIRVTLEKNIRLMVSGSAALPKPVSDRWCEITGHRLLERYGMSEIGMALTNPLEGERIVGAVGNPFPEVNVRIVKPNIYTPTGYDILAEGNHKHTVVSKGSEKELGELLVKGPNVFHKYWNKPEATTESFTKDGWFKTGDTAVYKDGVYCIVGRTSVDIIKSGGYKISALDIERHLLAHPEIMDCAVVGLPDITWGQKVAAVLTMKGSKNLELRELKEWGKDVLAPYQIPSVIKCMSAIPRNAMGKVNKKELVAQVFPEFLR